MEHRQEKAEPQASDMGGFSEIEDKLGPKEDRQGKRSVFKRETRNSSAFR